MTAVLRRLVPPILLLVAVGATFSAALPTATIVRGTAVALVCGLAGGIAARVWPRAAVPAVLLAALIGVVAVTGGPDPRAVGEAVQTFLVVGLPAGGLDRLAAVPFVVLLPAALLTGWAAWGERTALTLVGPVLALVVAALLTAPVGVPVWSAVAVGLAAALVLLTAGRRDLENLPPLVGTNTEMRRQRVWWRPFVQILPAAALLVAVLALPHPGAVDVRRLVTPAVDEVEDQNPLAVAARWGTLDTPQPIATVRVDGEASPGRLRLAVLDEYEPVGWRQDVRFAVTGDTLAADPLFPDAGSAPPPVRVEVDRTDVAGTFHALPTAGTPVSVEAPGGVRYAASAGLLLVPDDRRVATYEARPRTAPAPGADASVVADFPPGLGACPQSEVVRSVAQQLTAGAAGSMERLGRIEDWLLTRRVYDPKGPGGQTLASVERFLGQPLARGNLEVFVTSYAVLARCAGVPARVVVGFPEVGAGTSTLAQDGVTAWVEVPVAGPGWVAFDPVPTPEEQRLQAELAAQPPPPATPPTTAAPSPTREVAPTPPPEGRSGWSTAVLATVGVAAVAAVVTVPLLVLPWSTRRRRRRLADPTAAVRAAWAETTDALIDHGVAVGEHHTPGEVARVAAGSVPATVPHLLTGLGPLVDRCRYSGVPASDADAGVAWAYADAVLDRLPQGRGARLAPLAHPLRHLHRWRTTSGAARRSQPWGAELPDTAILAADAAPDDVPDVAVASRIGDGSTGTVYRGVHTPTGDPVAVKVFRFGPGDRGFDRQRFDWEVRIARDVSGLPNLPTVLDAGITPTSARPYIVSTLYERGTLLDHVRRGGPMTSAEARAIGVDLCRALDALHQMGVVHADVKPENVFAGPDGWVLGDLGSAWLRASRGPAATLTPPYAAPEVWRGSAPTPASDIYSLALTVLFAATGDVPIAGNPPPADVVEEAFADHPIVLRALDPDPRRRPRSVVEVARRLRPDLMPSPALQVRTLSLPTPTVSRSGS